MKTTIVCLSIARTISINVMVANILNKRDYTDRNVISFEFFLQRIILSSYWFMS